MNRFCVTTFFVCFMFTGYRLCSAADVIVKSDEDRKVTGSVADVDVVSERGYDDQVDVATSKSGVVFGIGASSFFSKSKRVGPHAFLGYSYFPYRNVGVRAYASLSYFGDKRLGEMKLPKGCVSAGTYLDVMLDLYQGLTYGFGISVGGGAGSGRCDDAAHYRKSVLYFINVGASLIFDGGRNRLEFMSKIPVNGKIGNAARGTNTSYMITYSHVF